VSTAMRQKIPYRTHARQQRQAKNRSHGCGLDVRIVSSSCWTVRVEWTFVHYFFYRELSRIGRVDWWVKIGVDQSLSALILWHKPFRNIEIVVFWRELKCYLVTLLGYF
jgi:hypothetical protein